MGTIAKQGFWGTVVTYTGVLIGVVTTFCVITRFLTAEEIGLSRVLVDTSILFIGLAGLGTTSSIVRFFPYFKSNSSNANAVPKFQSPLESKLTDSGTLEHRNSGTLTDHGFFFWMMLVPLVGFLIFSILYWIFHVPLQAIFTEKSQLFVDYYYFVLPMAFFMLYQTVFETCCNVKMRIVVIRAVREVLVRILTLGVYLCYAFHLISLDGFVIGLCIVYGIAALANALYAIFVGKISLRPDFKFLNRKLVRDYILYSGFLLLSAITTVLAPSLSSFFITAQLGLDYTGIFAIATYIAVMVSIPYRSLTAIAQPNLAEAMKNNDRHTASHLMKQVSNNLFLIGMLIFAAIILNTDLIFHLLPNGATYATAKNAIIFLGISQLCIATFTFTAYTLSFSRFYYLSLPLSLILTIGSVFLNQYLVPRYGMDGAALANLIAYATYHLLMVLTVWLTTKTTPLCTNQLKTIILALFIFGGNYLFELLITIPNVWFSSIIRSLIFLGSAVVITYYWQISPEITTICDKFLKTPKQPK